MFRKSINTLSNDTNSFLKGAKFEIPPSEFALSLKVTDYKIDIIS